MVEEEEEEQQLRIIITAESLPSPKKHANGLHMHDMHESQ